MPLWHCMPLLLSRQFHIISHHFTNCELLQYFLLMEYRGNNRNKSNALWAGRIIHHLSPGAIFPTERKAIRSLHQRPGGHPGSDAVACHVRLHHDVYWYVSKVSICINMYPVLTCGMQNYAKINLQGLTVSKDAPSCSTREQFHKSIFLCSLLALCFPLWGMTRTKSSNEFKRVQHKSFVLFNVFSPCLTMLHSEPILDPSNGLHGLKRHGLRNVWAATE